MNAQNMRQQSKTLAQRVIGQREIEESNTKTKFDLTVVIPTYNEEKFLPLLLQDLVDQKTDLNFEVIISDKSEDKTKEVALAFKDRINIKVVSPSTGRGVSVQRNFGASKAQSNMLLFLDADTRLYPKALQILKEKAMDKKYFVGSAWMIPSGDRPIDHVAMSVFNIYAVVRRPIAPVAPGAFMFVRKEIFDEIKGFDKDVWFAEDADLAMKLRKLGYRFAYIPAPMYKFSVRRMDEEGRISFFLKRIWDGLFYLFPKPIRKKLIIGYHLDGYDTLDKDE